MNFMDLPNDILCLIAEKSIKRYIEKSNCISLYSQIYDSNVFFKI